jgi:GxxExxY protein
MVLRPVFFRRPHAARVDACDVRDLSDYLNTISSQIIGAAIEVHRHLGPGFLENSYEDALAIELALRGISFERQRPLALQYKGQGICGSVLDLLVAGEVVVELKAVEELHETHRAQVLSYLKAGAFPLGLLINFNVPALRNGIRRLVLNGPSTSRPSRADPL